MKKTDTIVMLILMMMIKARSRLATERRQTIDVSNRACKFS